MEDTKKCPKCQSEMELGYIPDYSDAVTILACWHRGVAERASGWFSGSSIGAIKFKSRNEMKQGFPLEAHRCPKCSFVEFYAPTQLGS